MKQISLTQGQFALVDDEDFEELNKVKWCAVKERNTYYAARTMWCKKGKRYFTVKMHRVVLNLTDSKILCDHIDKNGLNNQKHNLRPSTNAENQRNRGSMANSFSKFKGVYWIKKINKWRASITINGKYISIGFFLTEIEAAKAYDEAAKIHHGEFAWLNFK